MASKHQSKQHLVSIDPHYRSPFLIESSSYFASSYPVLPCHPRANNPRESLHPRDDPVSKQPRSLASNAASTKPVVPQFDHPVWYFRLKGGSGKMTTKNPWDLNVFNFDVVYELLNFMFISWGGASYAELYWNSCPQEMKGHGEPVCKASQQFHG